jgi:molybdenum cofactor biosynthesis enzyme MoaA
LKTVLRLILLLAAAAFAAWLWVTLFPSPERVITHRLEKLARTISTHPNEGSLPRLLAAQSAAGYFAASVEISIDTPRHQQHATLARDEITQTVAAVNNAGGLTVKFPDINVTVNADGTTAQADVTVEAQMSGESDLMVQAMVISLEKTDGQWVITRVRTVRTLS